MANNTVPLRHIIIKGTRFQGQSNYRPKGGFSNDPPVLPRGEHGAALLMEMSDIKAEYIGEREQWSRDEHIKTQGLILEFEMEADFATFTESLTRSPGFQMLNQDFFKKEDGKRYVFQRWIVADGYLGVFEKMLLAYNDETEDTLKGNPSYRKMIDSIRSIKRGTVLQLWTEIEPFPTDDKDRWWEAWLRARGDGVGRTQIINQFRREAEKLGLRVGEEKVILPEHTILAVRGKAAAWSLSMDLLNCLAEIRAGRDFAGHFDVLPVDFHWDLAGDLSSLLEPEPTLPNGKRDERVALCVMDTGVNRGHPLIAERLPEERNLTIKDAWGSADDYGQTGHGTPMSGLCLYGDLGLSLNETDFVSAPFVLEAVKIVPPPHIGNDEERLAAAFTQNGVYRVEGTAPHRQRIWCISTSLAQPDVDGTPGSWSSILDRLASGADDENSPRRLFCLAGGNMPQSLWAGYPGTNESYSVHPPAQAWNALVVGSFTQLHRMPTANKPQEALVGRGEMAPTNSTTCSWDSKWPNRPDVVFEGGNAECDAHRTNAWEATDLCLMSTAADFPISPFCTMVGTSPAVAQAARMAAHIQAVYPDYWPETVRGLMVHSAIWTDAMRSTITGEGKNATSALLRKVGYGVPRLQTALECAKSRATIVIQTQLKPYRPSSSSDSTVMNELNTHSLPWPITQLRKHFSASVRMKVTLSYFIEPNPGSRGYASNYRYASCMLRFRVSAPRQKLEDLVADVDRNTDDSLAEEHVKGNWDHWILHPDLAHKGSVHSNTWEGSAADLADMKHIVVYPVTGWWKTRQSLGKHTASIRYSLIITLEAKDSDLDIYTEIDQQVRIPTELPAS